ncbi:MAG: ROK family protein, partial [Pseudonocardiaceae bacterium]
MSRLHQAHWFFDHLLRKLEDRRVSRERLADVVTRLMIAAPEGLSQSQIARGERLPLPFPLAPDSVSRATNALSSLHLATAQKVSPRGAVGRPYTPLRLGGDRWATVGVKIGHRAGRSVSLNILVTGLDGQPLNIAGYQSHDQLYVRDLPDGGLDELVEAFGMAVEEICGQPAVRKRYILGVGIELAGHVCDGKVINASHNDMVGVQLDQLLSRRLESLTQRHDKIVDRPEPLPVIIDNDVNVLAALETYRPWFMDHEMAVVAVFDDGIGAALILDGRVYRGARGMAGEIGHCLVPIEPDAEIEEGEVQPSSLKFSAQCHCGGFRHLDCYATPVRILSQLTENNFDGFDEIARAQFDEIAQRPAGLQGQETQESIVFRAAGRALGVGITGLVNVINPSRVLVLLPPTLVHTKAGSVAARY